VKEGLLRFNFLFYFLPKRRILRPPLYFLEWKPKEV